MQKHSIHVSTGNCHVWLYFETVCFNEDNYSKLKKKLFTCASWHRVCFPAGTLQVTSTFWGVYLFVSDVTMSCDSCIWYCTYISQVKIFINLESFTELFQQKFWRYGLGILSSMYFWSYFSESRCHWVWHMYTTLVLSWTFLQGGLGQKVVRPWRNAWSGLTALQHSCDALTSVWGVLVMQLSYQYRIVERSQSFKFCVYNLCSLWVISC